MTEMLTAKDMQNLLQVDRSTIYRMAEAKKLPVVKIGRQWRFPADEVEKWLRNQSIAPSPAPVTPFSDGENSAELDFVSTLPLTCIQLIQDAFAEAMDVMILITDMDGNLITQVSNPCGLYQAIRQAPQAIEKCVEDWAYLGEVLEFEPKYVRSHLGLWGARGLIRVGKELKGMVIVGGIAGDDWPPSEEGAAAIAAEFAAPVDLVMSHLNEAFYLDDAQKKKTLLLVQRMADIVAHIAAERITLVGKLHSIAELVSA